MNTRAATPPTEKGPRGREASPSDDAPTGRGDGTGLAAGSLTLAPAHGDPGTWVLQADAAVRTGFSVSAIRKWRRAGLVADRKRTTAGGLERVEVRLEDVQARMAEQPPERTQPAPVAEPGLRPGTATLPIGDLEGLFARVREAERRAEAAEARLQTAEVEARIMSGQLAELRRHVKTALPEPAPPARTERIETRVKEEGPVPAGGRGSSGEGPGTAVARRTATVEGAPRHDSARSAVRRPFDWPTLDHAAVELLGRDRTPDHAPVQQPPPVPPPSATPSPVRPRPSATPPVASSPPPARPSPHPERTVPRPAARPPAPAPASARDGLAPGPSRDTRRSEVGSLASELRRLYARLDSYRREPVISRARERQRERDLGDYDSVLLRTCSALSVPTGLRPGEPLGIERRAALTRALARAGIDVRVGPSAG